MANANAAEIARQVGGAMQARKNDQAREYWALVHGVVREEHTDAGAIAEKLTALGGDLKQFEKDVATVNARYDADELLEAVPEMRNAIAEADAEKKAAYEVFAAAEKTYGDACERHFAKVRDLNGRIATAEAGRSKLAKNNPYPWIRDAQASNGAAILEAEERYRTVNEWLQTAEHWLNADPETIGAKTKREQAELNAPKYRAELRDLNTELARLKKERDSIEAELMEP